MSGLHQVSEVDTAQTGLGEVEDMGGGGDFDNIEGVDGEDFEFSEDGEESWSDWDKPNFKKEEKKEASKKPTKEITKKVSDAVDAITEESGAGKPKGESKKEKSKDIDDEQAKLEESLNPKKEKVEAPKEEVKKSSAKKHYVKIGEDTFAIEGDASMNVTVDGQKVPVTFQELINEFSGKKYAEGKIAEYQKKESARQYAEKQFRSTLDHYKQIGEQIKNIASDESKDPLDAFKIFLDSFGYDSYDLVERMKISNLEETLKLMDMSELERKSYFLEGRNKHLLSKSEKRIAQDQQEQSAKNYAHKVDQLRKAHNVSDSQYLEAYDELRESQTEGYIPDEEIVSWAVSKPYRQTVQQALSDYEDQISDDAYSDLVHNLTGSLMSKEVTKEELVNLIKEQFGQPTVLKNINEKYNPIGKKTTQQKTTAKKFEYESFDDFND